jgi:hypothetical protein
MENQVENNSLDQTIVNNQVTESVIPKGESFQPVMDMFDSEENDVLMSRMDLAQFQRLDALKPLIDSTGIRSNGNALAKRPTLSSNTFDPVLQQNPPNLKEPGGFERMMDQSLQSTVQNFQKNIKPGTGVASPTFTGMAQSNFMRYYEHPKFQELGWKPYADNEAYYNANSTIYDDMSRMWGQFGSLAGTGFVGGYRSIGSMFSGESMTTDLKSATEFEDAMAIGNSSRGGALAWTNNLLLNSAYTVGIISSIAVEEVALAALEVATFGGATPLVAARTTANAARLARSIGQATTVGRLYSAGRGMMTTLKSIDAAEDFWSVTRAGGKIAAGLFAPETVAAVKRLKTTEVVAQNLTNMAKASEYAGSFYRDVRALNLALSESKLEGGMVYNQMLKDGMAIKFAENGGGPVTTEQVADIQNNAHKAAFATTMTNMPVIYLTNKLVLGNSLGGFNKSLGRIFNEEAKGIGRRIIKTAGTVGKDGIKTLNPFKDAGTGLKGLATTIANAGVKGNLTKLGQGSLRYFAANLGEGIQELSQEAISAGTKNYYTATLKDPMNGGNELFNASVKAGIGQQFSAQGFDVFMSGFLMGGVVSGPQKLFFQGVPALYQRVANPEKYNEYKQNRDNLIKSTVDTYNAVWNAQAEDPNSVFDPKRYNFLMQKAAAAGKTEAAIANNQFDFVDETDFAKFQQIHTVLSTGGAHLFQDQLLDYMKMSDENLATAFPSSKKDIKNGKIRERLQSLVNQIDKTQEIYEESKDRNPNPFTPEAYEKGSRQYTEETIKQIAFEHARYLYMFTQDGFTRALERSNSIYQSLASEPLFEKMAANDLTVLLDQDSINREVVMLTKEAEVLSEDKANDAKVKEKTERVKRLISFKLALIENQKKDGSFDKRKMGALRKEFEKYVKHMAQASGTFVNKNNVDAALKQIIDYTALQGRAKVYDKTIEYLNDPQKFDLVFQRTAEVLQEKYKNRKSIFEKQVSDYIGIIERNELANQIAKAGFIPDVEEMKMFLETGDSKYLKTFYNQKGEQVGVLTLAKNAVLPGFDKSDLEDIQVLLNDYEQTRPDKKVEEVKTDEVVAEESRTEVDDILENNGIDIEVTVSDSAVLDNSMQKAYAKYAAKQTATGKKPMAFDKWVNSEDGKNLRVAFIAVKKIWIDNDKLINPNNPLTEAEIQSESKLIPWLQSQEGKTNDLVQNVVNALGLTIDDVTGQTELLPNEGETVEGNKNVTIVKKGNVVSLIELKNVDSQGNVITSYQLVDQYKQPLDEETLNRYSIASFGIYAEGDKAKALAMQKTLDNAAPDTTKFTFDDIELNYGQLVYDQTGKEFIVLSQPKQVGSERKLLLIPSDEITPSVEDTKRATIPVKPGEFKASFSIQDLDLKVLPQSVSRLNINEPIQPYAYRNKDAVTDQWTESPEQAVARYNLILSILTPEELAELELVIIADPQGGMNNGNLIIPGFKEANPYIQTIRAKYSVGIRISNPDVQAKVDKAIAEKGLNKNNSENGIFGYMQNTNFIITNSQGTVINPATMTAEEYKNIIYTPEGMDVNLEEDLKRAQDNFALNNLLSSVLPGLVALNPDGVIALSKLPNGLSFISKPGVTIYDKSPKPLVDLEFSAADREGNYLIYQLENNKGGARTKVAISNLEGEERRQLIDKVEESLTKQGLLDSITTLTDAYVAAVLLPDGTYALVNLKAKSIDLNTKFLELINRAETTLSDNPEANAEKFDKRFNVDYNKGLRSELFISAKPGYRLSLQVSPWGKIELEISDSNNKQIGIVRLNKSEISNKDLSTEDKLNLLLDKFNALPAVVAADVNLTAANFRASYSREAGVQEILDKTTTQVAPQVVSPNAIQLSADSSAIQAAKNIPVVQQSAFVATEEVAETKAEEVADDTMKNRRMDLFPAQSEFADVVGGSNQMSNISSYKEVNGIGIAEYTNPENGLVDVIMTGKSDNDYVGYIRIYTKSIVNGNVVITPTNRWTSKMENKSGDKTGFKSMITEVQNLLPAGHEYTEKTNISLDGLRVYANNLKRDYEVLMDNGVPVINNVTLNKATLEKLRNAKTEEEINDLYEKITGITREEYEKIREQVNSLMPGVQTIFNATDGSVIIKLPVLVSTKGAASNAVTPEERADAVNVDNINPEDINIDDASLTRNGVRLNKLEAVKQQLELLKAQLTEGLVGAAKIKAVKDSQEYADLLAERKKLESEANKIIDLNTLTEDVEDIDAFTAWAAMTLPDFISMEDIETLGDNLKAGGVRVGAFVLGLSNIGGGLTVNGTLFTGAKSPFKYHEAFHGVFRMLLTDAEIKKYLGIARREVRAKLRAEGKSFEAELERFRNSANTYSDMSRERLEQEYYEEYLADEFEKFKANAKSTQTDSSVKSLFTRIMEWIQSVFKSFTKNQLLTLYENIDAGKFKNAGVSQNQFVTSLMTGVTLEANALLPYDTEQNANNKVGYYFLDSAIAEPLVSSIAAMYIQEISKVRDPNVKRGDILENVINDFAALYDEETEANQKLSDEQKKFLPQISEVFYNFSDELKSEVYKVLNIITKQTQEEEYNNEYFEEEVGLRNVEQYNMDASMIGGYGSLSEGLRSYLATTTIEETDYFGNKELKPGVKLIVPINFTSAYNGLLKAVKNIDDSKKMLQNMYFFGLDNPQTGAVVTRLLQDFGISVDTLLEPGPLPTKIKNSALFTSVVKGFTTFRVDYLFVQRDNAGAVLIYSAAQRDDINSQLESWSQAWGQAEKKIKTDVKVKNETVRTLEDFASYLKPSDTKLTGPKLSEISSKYSQDIFRLTGIKLSKQFIAFSIASSRNNPTVAQAALVNANSEQTPISYSDILEINKLIQQGNDIFSEGETGASSRLRTLAIQNAPFDETIGASVFKNPEGNLVYAHQLPTFHLKRIQELNDVEELERLKESDPYLANNFLLNSEAFIQMSAENRQKVLRIAGSSVGKINSTEEELNDKISGVSNKSSYGNYTPQEFALSILNTYTALLNTKSNKVDSIEYFDDKLNKTVKAALAPILIRVLEASNTGDLMYLPVVKAVKFEKPGGGKVVLTDEIIDAFTNRIETEYDRIRRESNPLTKTEETQLGYNNNEKGRAFQLINTGLLLTPELKTSLEEIAKREDAPSLKEALKELNITDNAFRTVVNAQLESQYTKFSEGLAELQIEDQLGKSITEGLAATTKANQNLIESAELLNLTYDKEYNLKQIFFNDWINTTSINDVLLGDQAITLKDGIDAVKRAKMQNAAYYSAYTSISAEELGVMHTVDDISLVSLEEPTGVSALTGNSIDRSDAQMWMTTKAFRYMWFGFGKLTPAQAKLIDRIEAGEDISSQELFGQDGYVDMGSMLNSKKLVYGDGKTFIKMSAFVLTPQLTSNKVVDENGNVTFVAKENKVDLHNLRVKLEAIEKTKETISIAAPLSALKMLKQRVNPLSDLGNTNSFTNGHTTLSAKYMGLQVLTPSNKTEVIDPTQVKNIVTSEQKDSVYVEALGMTVGQIRTAYNLATSAKVELKFKNKRNLIFSFEKGMQELAISKQNNKITPNLTAFLRYATEGLKASQASSNLLEFFSTQDGEQKYDLNNPITLNKFEQLFLSYLSKGALAEKAPGHAVALVSDFGTKVYRRVFSVDENGVPDRSEIIRENVWNSLANKPQLGEYDTLSVTLKDNKEGVVILDRLRSGVKEYDKDGKFTGERYTEMLMPAHFKSVMDLIENSNGAFPDVLSKMFAVRIPSQDNHSTINVKHVDFLPGFYGSSAMFAQELIEISGADFDIDKVYMQIKEFYEDKGQFYEYGKQTTDNGKYTDYLKYVSEKVNQPGTTYAEALELYKNNLQASSIANSVTDIEQEIASDAGLSENGMKALQILGLPITKEQYLEYKKNFREPYEAPMNNAILDYKYALMGNTGVTETTNENETPISYTAASLQILQDSLAELEEVLPGLLERSREDNIDINNIIGKIKAFTNNKGAAIGAIVLPNVYLSLLTEYGIKINDKGPTISVNGITYDNFGVTREQLPNGLEGLRKQDIISALITMATDNAKERLVAKLGLNKHALGVVANLTALGVPIKTSLLLINNPMIQDIYSQALNKKDKLDPGVTSILNSILVDLTEKRKTVKLGDAKSIEAIKVNDNLLIDAFNNPEEVTNNEKIAILNLFLNAVQVKDFTSNMSAVAGLTNGLGKDIASVNEKADQIDKLFDKDAMMDLNPIYKSKTWQSKYLEIFNQIRNDLLPATFLSASENFQAILTKVLDNVNSDSIEFTEETKAKISRDLLSYLTIKAYQQNKLNNDPQSVATLNNNLVYPGGGYESINDVVDRMRTTEAGQNNFFLDNFAISEKATDSKNQTGLNLVNANTFRSLNAGQKVDLQNSFAKLYGSLETKDDALSIINYIMVKDGLQVGYASLLEAVSPFTMDSYLSQIETANKALRTNDDANIKKVFGLNRTQLESDFVNNYLQSNINGPLLYTFSINDKTGLLPKGVSIKENKVTIKWDDMGKVSPKDFVRYRIEDIQTGFVTYKTYMSTTQDESITKVYEEIETKGSNQQTPIGFMFGERPTYKEVRQSIKIKNATTGQDAYADNIQFEAEENYALSAAEMIQLEALNDESANIEATEFGVNINGNNIANISALEAMLTAKPKESAQSKGVEISSNAKGLAAALTNPTELAKSKGNLKESYPVYFQWLNKEGEAEDNEFKDVEQAYQKLKDNSEAKTKPAKENSNNYKLMVELIKAKLEQHPRLVSEITKQGGSAWILSSTHQPTKQNSVWETGGQNWFIESLNDAYLSVAQPAVKEDIATTLVDSMSDLERELYEEFAAEVESDYLAIENFWDANIQKDTQAKENLRLNNNVLSLEDLIDMYNKGIYTSQEEFIEQIKQCNL